MIPPSLARLIEKWRKQASKTVWEGRGNNLHARDKRIQNRLRTCADELSAALQSMTAEEPVAVADDPRCVTQTIKLPAPTLTDEMCEAFAEALWKHIDINDDGIDDGRQFNRPYLQAVWNDIWSAPSARPPLVAAKEIEGDAIDENALTRIRMTLKYPSTSFQPADIEKLLAAYESKSAHPQPLVAAEAAAKEIDALLVPPFAGTLIQQIAAIIRQHSQERAEWQPIETAPIGTKSFLVYCEHNKNIYVVTQPAEGLFQHFGGSDWRVHETPTHWQPLPAAPLAGSPKQEKHT